MRYRSPLSDHTIPIQIHYGPQTGPILIIVGDWTCATMHVNILLNSFDEKKLYIFIEKLK